MARIWIDYANTRFVPAWGALLRAPSETERASARDALFESLAYLETQGLQKTSGKGPFWFGEQPGLVDLTFYPVRALGCARAPPRAASDREVRALQRWREALAARPSVKDIENPTQFYVERYARYAAPVAQAAAV